MKIHNVNEYIKNDAEFFKIVNSLPRPTKTGPWVAGGSVWKAIEGIPFDCDVDYFFKDQNQFTDYLKVMKSIPFTYSVISKRVNGYNVTFEYHTYRTGYNKTNKIQFISFKYWNDIETLINDFDFTACQFAYDGEKLYTGDNSLLHMKNREIVFHNINNINLTDMHLNKYLHRGFKISDEQNKIYAEIKKSIKTKNTVNKQGFVEVNLDGNFIGTTPLPTMNRPRNGTPLRGTAPARRQVPAVNVIQIDMTEAQTGVLPPLNNTWATGYPLEPEPIPANDEPQFVTALAQTIEPTADVLQTEGFIQRWRTTWDNRPRPTTVTEFAGTTEPIITWDDETDEEIDNDDLDE